jgi:hypothetical protein
MRVAQRMEQAQEQMKARGALKLRDAAEYLGGVSQISVRRAIARGLIKPNRSFRHLLIPISELDRFLAEGQR